jgi:hypothetical protein
MPDWIAQRESRYWSGFAVALAFGCLSVVLFQKTTSGTSAEKSAEAKEPMEAFAFTPQERTPPAPLWPTIELASARSDDPIATHSRDPAVDQKNEKESFESSARMVADAEASRFVALPPVTVPRSFLGASMPMMGNWGLFNFPVRALGNGMYESIPNWQAISTVHLIPMTMSNRPNFVENGVPIHGVGEQLLPTETRVRSPFADSSSWSSEPATFREPVYPYPDHLNGEQQADLDVVIRLLVREDLAESAKKPDKLFAEGREITDQEPRLFYAMGLNSLRHHRFDEALDYIKQAKQRSDRGYFAPWRDYIRLLALDRKTEEVAGELEELSRAVARHWEEVPYSSSAGVDAGKLNTLFLGRMSGYVQCTVGSADRPPALFLGREKLIENELPPALLPIFRNGKAKIEAEIAEQRRRDDERLAAIHSRWREMIKTGQKGTTNVDNTTISTGDRGNFVHMQGNLGLGSSAGSTELTKTLEDPYSSYSKLSTHRQRYAENIARTHRTDFEKAKVYSPYLRSEQMSYYEPVSAYLSARDLIATLPTISSEYLSRVESNGSMPIAEID